MSIVTKLQKIIKLLFVRVEAVQYDEVKEGIERLHPDLLNWTPDLEEIKETPND